MNITPEPPNHVARNIEYIEKAFPNCIREETDSSGKKVKRVDFDTLRMMLGDQIADGHETYEFTWVGKKNSIMEANRPIHKTLRPEPGKSVQWDTTRNIYIEGENLDVLKLLQNRYSGKIKVIYIDPPYNTGSDFIYNDNFSESLKDYGGESKAQDSLSAHLVRNRAGEGRFHSKWCSMIYSRLLLSRELLRDDGVIFISIDDHEQENLKKICNEIFGEKNFLAQIIWERAYSPVNLKQHFSESHDYILCYARNISAAVCNGLPRSAAANSRYHNPDNDPRGPWKSSDLSVGPRVESKVYEIITPSGRRVWPPSGYCWRLDRATFDQYVKDNRIWFGPEGNNVPSIKRFLSEVKQGITPMTIWKYKDVGHSQDATKELKEIFDGKAYFDYPKPVDLIKRCLQLYSDTDSIIMDFFSGSGTTAQAVMELNAEDKGSRRYILVQLPEKCAPRSIAYQDGYHTICDIGLDRIRRSSERILKRYPKSSIDYGVKVFRLEDEPDESGMEDEDISWEEYFG